MAKNDKNNNKAVKQAVKDAGKNISQKELNQILKIADSAVQASKAIANSGATVNAQAQQALSIAKAVEYAGPKVNTTEYNQISSMAGGATNAYQAISGAGSVLGTGAQQLHNQAVVSGYDYGSQGGSGLGKQDVSYLTSVGVDKAGIKTAAEAAPWVSNNVYNTYGAGTTKEVLDINRWMDSVNQSNQDLINSINTQITSNNTDNTDLLNRINDLTLAISTAQQQQELLQGPQGAYAVVTGQNAPAAGAKTTSAITPRRKPTRNALSISPAASSAAGAGLNIAA